MRKTNIYCICPKSWDRQAGENSVDTDQTPQAASDQSQHCLLAIQRPVKWTSSIFRTITAKS